jgi:hypothetical protein
MDAAAHLRRRIDVVTVTTRAAAASLPPGDGHVRVAVERGIQLLDGMADEVADADSPEAAQQLAQAREELASLLEDTGG